MTEKWNVVYTKTVAGTVSQEKVDEYRKSLKKLEADGHRVNEGIWNIELNGDSPDSDYAKVLMLQHDVIEEEDLEMEMEECDKI
jgi:hypothetical protein